MAEPAITEFVRQQPQVTLCWKAFELRPYPVPTLDPHGEYLTSAWQNHVYPLAEKMGFSMNIPPIQPRTRLAHAAAKWAAEKFMFTEYNFALFKAFFQDGRDIGNLEILMQITAELGMDPAELKSEAIIDSYVEKVLQDEKMARQVNVRAVPAYVSNGKVLAAGVQSLSRLQQLFFPA